MRRVRLEAKRWATQRRTERQPNGSRAASASGSISPGASRKCERLDRRSDDRVSEGSPPGAVRRLLGGPGRGHPAADRAPAERLARGLGVRVDLARGLRGVRGPGGSQFRQGLIEARVQSLLTQGDIIAGAIAASATVDTDARRSAGPPSGGPSASRTARARPRRPGRSRPGASGYLNQFRQGLIEARVQSLLTQGDIIAGAIAASATVD
jgi:two-component system sensor histidine kinase ChvG